MMVSRSANVGFVRRRLPLLEVALHVPVMTAQKQEGGTDPVPDVTPDADMAGILCTTYRTHVRCKDHTEMILFLIWFGVMLGL